MRDRDEKQLAFRTTRDLRECIERIARKWEREAPKKKSTTHPATRCFQALRIYVNEELQHVEVRGWQAGWLIVGWDGWLVLIALLARGVRCSQDGLHALIDQLAPGGRLGASQTC